MAVIETKIDASANFTITLNALAASGGRQSTIVTNSDNRPAALIRVTLSPGTAPTAGTVYEVYLIRGNAAGVRDDLAGASDAAFTPVNAPLLGTLINPGSTTDVQEIFDTSPLGPLGSQFGIAVVNRTNQALDSGANAASYQTYLPEIV